MRLIDADEVKQDIYKYIKEEGRLINPYRMLDYIDSVETSKKAIPIDKPFLKMRYGNYVVYNKEWLVNHLQTEWNILQGKEYQPAIPVEWLEQNAIKWGVSFTMKRLLDAWEKENENN